MKTAQTLAWLLLTLTPIVLANNGTVHLQSYCLNCNAASVYNNATFPLDTCVKVRNG